MQNLGKTIALSVMAFMIACLGNFTFANGVSSAGLPSTIEIMETNPKAFFAGASNEGMQRHLLNQSVVKANIYSIIYKDKADYRYGLVGDVQLGNWFLKSFAYQNNVEMNQKDDKLKTLLDAIENYVVKHNSEYSFMKESSIAKGVYVISPKSNFVENAKDNSYEGLIGTHFYKSGVMYQDLVHVKLYNDPYYGPSVRFVLLKNEDNAMLWPKTKVLLAIK